MEKANTFKKLIVRSKNKPEKVLAYAKYIQKWAWDYLQTTTAEGYALGISGGIDSALAASLLSTIKDIKFLGLFIDIESNPKDYEDAKAVAKVFNFELKYINLTAQYQELVKVLDIANSNNAKINLKSRLRAVALYAQANKNNLLASGTSNADERLVGYYTKFGDSACDISPLCYLTKANIRYLASQLGVPTQIINKAPSAGLYENQTDEKDMGISYNEIDHYLCYGVVPNEAEAKINAKYFANKHKFNAPAKPKKLFKLRNLK